MKEEELETLKEDEVYVLSPKLKGRYDERTYLLRNGELVYGCIHTSSRQVVIFWKDNGDTYLGIGMRHW